jgi:hypothetical protein
MLSDEQDPSSALPNAVLPIAITGIRHAPLAALRSKYAGIRRPRNAQVAPADLQVPVLGQLASAVAWTCASAPLFSRHVWPRSPLLLVFSIPPDRPTPNIAPSWNVGADRPFANGLCGPNKPDERGTTIGCRRGDRMIRREFIALAGGAAVAWPLGARAQQSEKVYKIGILNAGSRPPWLQSGLRDGLRELGWVEDKNLTFEERYAEDSLALNSDLSHPQPDLTIVITMCPPKLSLQWTPCWREMDSNHRSLRIKRPDNRRRSRRRANLCDNPAPKAPSQPRQFALVSALRVEC